MCPAVQHIQADTLLQECIPTANLLCCCQTPRCWPAQANAALQWLTASANEKVRQSVNASSPQLAQVLACTFGSTGCSAPRLTV